LVEMTPMRELGILFRSVISFLLDQENCRSLISKLVEEALRNSRTSALWTAFQTTVTAFRFKADIADLAQSPQSCAARLQAIAAEMEGTEHLQEALSRENGVIVACSFFSCFFYALACAWPWEHDGSSAAINIVVPQDDPQLQKLLSHITMASGKKISLIAMGSRRAAMDFIGALRRKEIVVCMVDNIPGDGAIAPCAFFGKPACLPAGYLSAAVRDDIPIVVAGTVYRSGRYTHWISQPIITSAFNEHTRLQDAADRVAHLIEERVRARPGSWNAWPSVKVKWEIGAALHP
jgi:lauroyl/myristoyl acyltransferase